MSESFDFDMLEARSREIYEQGATFGPEFALKVNRSLVVANRHLERVSKNVVKLFHVRDEIVKCLDRAEKIVDDKREGKKNDKQVAS